MFFCAVPPNPSCDRVDALVHSRFECIGARRDSFQHSAKCEVKQSSVLEYQTLAVYSRQCSRIPNAQSVTCCGLAFAFSLSSYHLPSAVWAHYMQAGNYCCFTFPRIRISRCCWFWRWWFCWWCLFRREHSCFVVTCHSFAFLSSLPLLSSLSTSISISSCIQ